MGEMKATTFVRLLELLVKSVHCMGLKYGGVELSLGLWRRCRCGQLESFWEWGGAIHQPNGQKTNRKNPQTLTPAVHVRTRVNKYASCAYKRPAGATFIHTIKLGSADYGRASMEIFVEKASYASQNWHSCRKHFTSPSSNADSDRVFARSREIQ